MGINYMHLDDQKNLTPRYMYGKTVECPLHLIFILLFTVEGHFAFVLQTDISFYQHA